MWRTRWLRTVVPFIARPSGSSRSMRRRRGPASRPALEALEDRTLLSFAAAVPYPVGRAAQEVVVGDFNRDGRLDLATSNFFNDQTVSVLLGTGGGTFHAAQHYAIGLVPFGGDGLGVGDLNGDSFQDLVVGAGGGNHLRVLLNNGDGTFQLGAHFTSFGTDVHSLVLRDFDGDGRLDLAAAMHGTLVVNVHLGNGDGTFQPFHASRSYAAGTNPNSVAAADVNGDGRLDLVVANDAWASSGSPGSGNVGVFLGNGDGTFQPRQAFRAGDMARGVAVGDFDGDGHPDLAVANWRSGSVSVLRNTADGTGSFSTAVHYATGSGSSMVAVVDFDGDCRLDLVVTNSDRAYPYTNNTVSLLRGNGDGTFETAQNIVVGRSPQHAAAGDFNGDGSLDLAVATGGPFTPGPWTATVLLNTTIPTHRPPVLSAIPNQTVSEGSTLTLTVSATDPDEEDTLTYSLVAGPTGASIDPATGQFTWTAADGPATVTVTVRVTDSSDCAHTDTRSFTVTVLNVAPAPGITGPTSGTPGQALSFTLSATDPSAADQAAGFTYVIDWGDGSPLQTVDAFPGSGSGVTVSHAYAAAGAYVVQVSAIDKDGGTGTAMLAEPVMIASAPGNSDLSWSGGGILAPPPVAAGEAFTIGRTFAVGGEAVGPFTIAYWASVDDIFGNEDDFLVGVELIDGAAPGIHSGTSPAFTIGAAGSYFLFAVLDSDGQVNEIDEGNNVVMALFPLLVSELADDEEDGAA